MFERICVVGAGGWGTALSMLLSHGGSPVRLWAHGAETADELQNERTNSIYLPGVRISDPIEATTDLGIVNDADLVVLVVPSRVFRDMAGRLKDAGLRDGTVVVSCTKGIEFGSGLLMTQILEECLPGCRSAVLSGPNLAAEVSRGVPAAGVIGSAHAEVLPTLQRAFSKSTYRAYTSDDVAGIQLGGALKNVFAIAAGASDGLGMGSNSKAALVTRALVEMTRLGCTMGGRRETFSGLSGIGDLMVTCFSELSRNHGFGERLGRGESSEAIQASMKMVAEGVPTAKSALECARRLGVDAPITAQVHAVVHEGKSARDGMWELLDRPPKPEADEARK